MPMIFYNNENLTDSVDETISALNAFIDLLCREHPSDEVGFLGNLVERDIQQRFRALLTIIEQSQGQGKS